MYQSNRYYLILVIILLILPNLVKSQCPVPVCTYTAVSGTDYTVARGETICIPNGVNYNSGTITLNGGTIHVASGGTLDANRYVSGTRSITNSSNSTPIVITTSTPHSLTTGDNVYIRSVGGNTNSNSHVGTPYVGEHTITVLTATTFSIDGSSGNNNYTSGGVVNFGGTLINCGTVNNVITNSSNQYLTSINNYSNGNTLSVTFDTKQGPIINNYGTGVSLAISNWNAPGTISNKSGASMTITSSPFSMEANSLIENDGILSWTPSFNTEPGVTINNNSGAQLNLNNASRSDFRGAIVNNSGDIAMSAGAIFQTSANISNNLGGTITSSSGLFDITTNSVIENSGEITGYDVRFQGTATVNMYDGGVFTVAHQVNILDYPLTAVSGCSFIDLGTATTVEATTSLNANLTQGGAGTTQVCGKVPYYTTDEITITNATNTSPINVTIAANINGRVFDGAVLYINGVLGNTAANGLWAVANYNAGSLSFDLVSSTGNGAYSSGGKVYYRHKWGTNANYIGYSGCTASDPCTALPVTWLDFNAILSNGIVDISWSTADEYDNDHFELQRSIDGINFYTIELIESKGNTSGVTTYYTSDLSPATGTSYYRVKQIDLDGKSTVTDVRRVVNSDESIRLYPNPLYGSTVFIELSHPENYYGLNLIDPLGRNVLELNSHQLTSLVSLELENKISAGIYFIQLIGAEESHFLRLVIK